MDVQENIFGKLTRGVRFNSLNKKVYSNECSETMKEKNSIITNLKAEIEKQNSKSAKQEKISHFRNNFGIKVSGKNIPDPVQEFIELKERFNVNDQLIDNLKACGYKSPTPVQMQVIPAMLNDRQILACAPTGSGKTSAFLVPVLAKLQKPSRKGFRALIICPTRELAKQIYRDCTLLSTGTGIKVNLIGKVTLNNKKFGSNFSKKFDILISTPNRLIYLMNQEREVVSFCQLKWLVVDESDKLFETGIRGFRDQLAEIYKSCGEHTKLAMFSATYNQQVSKWSRKNIKNILFVTIGQRNTTVRSVEQELAYVGNEDGKLIAFRNLIANGLPLPVLVFVQSKEKAKQLFSELIFDGINVDVIHADRTQLQRDNVVKAFREGKIWVLICSELMSRGIDFKGVKLVINYDFPPSATSYIHRIGRTGRAGRFGKAITYFTDDDKPLLIKIARVIQDSGGSVPEYILSLQNKKLSKRIKSTSHKSEF